jgi:hypothetical protein
MKESKYLNHVIEEKSRTQYLSNNYRLWHQLTSKILEFFNEHESAPFQISLFQNFVAEWEDKINQLSLVSIALQAAKQFSGK